MPTFGEQLLSQAIRSSIAEEERKRRKLEKIESDKLSLLANPTKLDKLVADFTSMVSPSSAKPDTSFASKVDATDANIPDDHPMKGYGQELREGLKEALSDPQFRGIPVERIVLGLASYKMESAPEGEKNLVEKSHEYKYKKDYSLTNWGGLFGEDETVRALPGYEEFKKRKKAITPEEIKTSYKKALGIGAGFAAGGQLTRRAAIRWGGKKLRSWGARKLVTGAALGPYVGLASMAAVPAFKIFDATTNVIERTHFGRSQGALAKFIPEAIIGGLIPTYIGHKALTKTISKAAEKGLIKEGIKNALMRLPTAERAIKLGEARAVERATQKAADEAVEKLAKNKTAKRQIFKAVDDDYTRKKFGVKDLTRAERQTFERDLARPFTKEFTGAKVEVPKSVDKIFANFTEAQSDAALARSKDIGIRKATQQVDEGIKVVELQKEKEIKDGIYKGLENVVRSRFTPKHDVDDLVKNFPSKKKTRIAKKVVKEDRKIKKAVKEVDNAVDKEVLAAKIIELEGNAAAARERLADMGARFRKTGLYKTKTGATVLKKGKKVKETVQVPDEVIKKKEAEVAKVSKPIPEGMEEISYAEAKRRLLKDMMAKKNPVKEELVVKPAIDNAETSIGKQIEKQQGRKLTKNEMSDAEWLARAGEAEGIDDIFATTDGLMKEEFDPGKWKFFVAGAASIPLLSLFESGEAEASMTSEALNVLAKSKVPKFVVDSLKATGKSLKQLRKEMIEQNLVYIPAAEGQKYFGERMKAISVAEMVAERGEKLADQVIRSKSLPFGFDRLMGMAGFSRLFFKAGGEPAIELGSRKFVSDSMAEKGMQVFDNIVSNIKDYDANPKFVIEAMQSLAKRFAAEVGAFNAVEYQIKVTKGARNKLLKSLKSKKLKGQDRKDTLIGLEEAKASLTQLKSARDKLEPVARQFEKDYEATIKILAKDNPAVRLSLAAEDTSNFKFYPWLKDMMTFEEKEAVGYYKRFMDEYAEEIVRVYGKDAVIESRPYIHHAFHPEWQTRYINDELARLKLKISPHPPYTELHSRAKYSKQMVPHIGYNTGRYIPDVEKRLQMKEFWNGWDSIRRSPMVQNSNALREFFQRIHNASIPASDHWSNKAANWYVGIEVFMLLGLSTSVAFKHLFKVPGTWAQLGFVPAIKHIPESLKIFARTFSKRDSGRSLAAQMNLSGKQGEKAVSDLVTRTFARQYGYMNTIMDMDMSVNVNSTFESGLRWLNEKGGILVKGVEHFDRAHGILAATHMAANRGMTAKQATYGVVDTILKNNFLSGVLNPSWMHSPKVRALFLFQNTAFKIFERRLVGGIKALELSKEVGKSVKLKGLKQTLKELRGVRQFIKEGEHEFKESIILDALNADRGYFGTPQSIQFMKEMLIMGAIINAGGLMGTDLWEHVNHLPFLKGHTKYPVLATSPIFNAMFDVKGNRAKAARDNKAPEFMMTDFLKEWLWQGKYGPYPQSVKKAMRLSNNDIPHRYRDSKFKYLFGIPATE